MFTIKIISKSCIDISQSLELNIIDERSGNGELKAHIADCNIKAANLAIKNEKPATGVITSPAPVVRHDDMKAAVFAGSRSWYLYPGDKCYITNDEGKTVHSLNYQVAAKDPKSEFTKMLDKLATEGGCIVSSADCSEIEIADAKCRDDFYVDHLNFGYVRRLPEWMQKHSRFARGANETNCEGFAKISAADRANAILKKRVPAKKSSITSKASFKV